MNRYALALTTIFILVTTVASARWIDDKVAMPTKNVGTVKFSHYDHLDALGQDCPTCHNAIFNIDRKKNKPVPMAQMEKGKSCGTCHNGTRAFSVAGDCDSCHAGDIDIAGVTFKHSIHIDMYGCDDCHSDIFQPSTKNQPVSMTKMEKGASCGACHNGDDAFSVASDCGSCHTTRDIMFTTEGAGNILFSHEIHIDMVSCSDCHARTYKSGYKTAPVTMAQMEKGQSCGACHNGGVAFAVAEDCASCHPTKDITFKTETAGNILFSHEVHTEMFGCADCHSDLFLPNANNQTRTMAEMESGESCGACHDGGDAFSVSEDCSSCHPTRDITFKTGTVGSVLFSHDVHTSMVSCSDCHDDVFKRQAGNPPVSMAQMESGESCGTCHDGSEAFSVSEDCSSCHPTRDITFEEEEMGNVLFSHEVHTDMFGCGDCHSDLFKPTTENKPVSMEKMENGESCGACHDGGDAFSVAEDCESCHIEE